jgi:F0F1-type ATP synthase assembly protein I
MKKAAAHPTTKSASGNDHYSLGTLASDLLDTTWRITIPVLLFAGAGIFIDTKTGSAPWATLAGTVIGFLAATALLKRQLKEVEQLEDNK